ncbi:MAG: hypothetical protein OEW58_00850 [Gammaproteobacteria bacterium]|nr:hypothetical protein [Gammaproteobacteria bacterium]
MKLASKAVLSLLVVALGVAGCKSKSDEEKPIDLPPRLSMVVNYDDFPPDAPAKAAYNSVSQYDFSTSSVDTLKQTYAAMAPTPSGYFSEAAIKVIFWKAITDIGLLVPRLAFISAFSHKPVKDENDHWVWNYPFGLVYTARLVGYVQNSQVHWEMYISKNDGTISNFKWYTGTHDLAYTSGSWVMYESAANPTVELLQIDWTRDPVTATGSIKYTNIKVGDAENGGYIYYDSTTPQLLPGYDRNFDIFNKGQNNLTEIEWNHLTKVGRIKSPNTVGVNWVYWDATLANSAAPPLQ